MKDSQNAITAMALPNWDNRSWVTGSMLNPALIATTLVATANMYEEQSGDAMPWELAFLSVPMVLHRDTREALPTRINSHTTKWVAENAALQASFPSRARSMVPYTREGMRFGLRTGSLRIIDGEGLLGTPSWKLNRDRDRELALIIGKASFLGRWFARTGPPATLYALFGVAP
ncbi:three component ABC system middle component [Microbacterium resistens]|uniref:three component ABC system middle component n=1 Tax=Microbacterium resistens TaxID=156977 RepID=UPI000A6CDBFE|nr:three component ABC system middle component [Microbacterium resistens]